MGELTEGVRRTPCRVSGRGQADFRGLEPVLFHLHCGTRVPTTGSCVWGRSPGDRVQRLSHCREYGSAGTAPSQQAVPVGVVPWLPVPPRHLPRRSRAPAARQPTRSVRGWSPSRTHTITQALPTRLSSRRQQRWCGGVGMPGANERDVPTVRLPHYGEMTKSYGEMTKSYGEITKFHRPVIHLKSMNLHALLTCTLEWYSTNMRAS
jgi:hypothetical protein